MLRLWLIGSCLFAAFSSFVFLPMGLLCSFVHNSLGYFLTSSVEGNVATLRFSLFNRAIGFSNSLLWCVGFMELIDVLDV